MSKNNEIKQIFALLQKMSSSKIKMVRNVVESLSKEVVEIKNPNSDIVDDRFASTMLMRFLFTHSYTQEFFNKKSFEYAFEAACKSRGWDACLTHSGTYPGRDLTVEGNGFSLKTEAAKTIKKDEILISKFSEARWIREAKSKKDRCKKTRELFKKHLKNYSRIFTLRAFAIDDTKVCYELIEIPKTLFELTARLSSKAFSDRTTNNTSRIDIYNRNGEMAFRIVLDGSVEKVQIQKLKVSLCIKHASWTIPLPS